jgi:hypothetical protein
LISTRSLGSSGWTLFLTEDSAYANEVAGEFLGAKNFAVAWKLQRLAPL